MPCLRVGPPRIVHLKSTISLHKVQYKVYGFNKIWNYLGDFQRVFGIGLRVEGLKELFKEMISAYVKVEQVLATLETLADKEALKTIEKSREEVAKGDVECLIDDLERALK